MRSLVLLFPVLALLVLAPAWAAADIGPPPPTPGDPPAPAPDKNKVPPPTDGSAAAPVPTVPVVAPVCAPPTDPLALRKICADAMNANPTFAHDVVEAEDKDAANRRLAADAKQHEEAARHIATNERHVILAYAAMWLVAVGFVLFLGRRQVALRREIAQLRRELDAAAKES